jgi:ubiquinone/menaquinone biosynthesis C-methylase UbiE
MNKDLFSTHANIYAAFRPTYPEELFQFIFQFVRNKRTAWDCGTGNGQVAQRLASDFIQVFATDLSEKQIAHAVKRPNITYLVAPAEQTDFEGETFDLITVGQALHWFNVEAFYDEVRRVARPDAIIAVWGYGNIMINSILDTHVQRFYSEVVGKYWDSARRHVETAYREIPFPFQQIQSPAFFIEQRWTLKHLAGYLESWSATQRYILKNGTNPVKEIEPVLRDHWGKEETIMVRFPIFLRMAKVF